MSAKNLEDYITFGPLIYAKDFFEDDGVANYFWPGSPAVSYNDNGVPVDKNNMECLDLDCPLHPNWIPTKDQMWFSDFLNFSIPSYCCYIKWLKENSLGCTPEQAKKLLFSWILKGPDTSSNLKRIIKYEVRQKLRDNQPMSFDEFIKKVYENEPKNTNN